LELEILHQRTESKKQRLTTEQTEEKLASRTESKSLTTEDTEEKLAQRTQRKNVAKTRR